MASSSNTVPLGAELAIKVAGALSGNRRRAELESSWAIWHALHALLQSPALQDEARIGSCQQHVHMLPWCCATALSASYLASSLGAGTITHHHLARRFARQGSLLAHPGCVAPSV